jgi:OOP family OmpA-OmpF porin
MRLLIVAGLLMLSPLATASDVEGALFAALDAELDAGNRDQLPLLTPEAWERALGARNRARASFERNRSLDVIQRQIDESRAALKVANELAPTARALFEDALAARADASSADAERIASRSWQRGEEEFRTAAVSLERGRGVRAKRRAVAATAIYREAELEAIQGAILMDVRALLAQADRDKVERFAPVTLAAARQSLADAERYLVEDRYDTDRPRLVARQAREEASHALYLSANIKAIEAGEFSVERAMLDAEKPVLRMADALDITPNLSNGVAATTDAILAEVKRMQRHAAELRLAIQERDERITTLESALAGTSQEAMALSSLLAEQEARRSRVEEVERLFADDEAEVLRAGGSLIIRLVGLTFGSGESELRAEHRTLLAKVQRAMAIFTDSAFTVEGHTDSFGSDQSNNQLSQRRADAVRTYLLRESGVPEYRIMATGYGESRPIATNETAEGRARNRRIDFVIVRT